MTRIGLWTPRALRTRGHSMMYPMIRTKHAVIVVAAGVGILLFILLILLVARATNASGAAQSSALITGLPQQPYDVERIPAPNDQTAVKEALLARLTARSNDPQVPLSASYYGEGNTNTSKSSASESDTSTTAENIRLIQTTKTDGTHVQVSLPLEPNRAGTPQELISDIIGVSTNGTLMQNVNDGTYDSLGGTVLLVGYALDGFGIYPDSGATDLDMCGGRVSPVLWNDAVTTIYHYELSADSSRILNCFAGVPVDITS